VTTYHVQQNSIADYLNADLINPLEGHPLYSTYALKWMGLDPQNGDPQGWLDGHISKEYSSIATSADFNNLLYAGPSFPPYYGSLRNTFHWKAFEFSFNVTYKFGYVFRRPSIDYYDMFSGASPGHSDYDKRWVSPGDEKFTNVPSALYPADPYRDQFYANSQALIEKGDHMRLQDIRFSYNLKKGAIRKLPLQWAQAYFYASNIAILWRANHQGIDPDVVPLANTITYPNPRSITMGIKFGL
jgi:hypothetical protein